MGNGDDELGKILIKGFIYALSQIETHPDTILSIMEVQNLQQKTLKVWKI